MNTGKPLTGENGVSYDPLNPAEYEFTYAEPAIEDGEALEAKMIVDENGASFTCRDCGQILDIERALGCACFMCEDCAMMYVGD